jgi:hypothetical protein
MTNTCNCGASIWVSSELIDAAAPCCIAIFALPLI